MPARTSTVEPPTPPFPAFGSERLVDEDALTRSAPLPSNLAVLGGYALVSRVSRGGVTTRFLVQKADGGGARFAMTVAPCGSALRTPVLAAFAEAECTGRTMDHAGLARVVDGGIDAGFAYLVTTAPREPATTLRSALAHRGEPMPLAQVAHLVLRAADALGWMHARGHTHRLLCPDAIVLAAQDEVELLDAALACAMDSAELLEPMRDEMVPYLAPEELDGTGGPVTAARDVFALASIAYECLAGEPAFPDGSRRAVARAMNAPVRPNVTAVRTGVPRAVGPVLARAWAVWPLARYASVRLFALELARALSAEPTAGISGERPVLSLEAPRVATGPAREAVPTVPAPKMRPMRRPAVTQIGRYAIVREIASGGMARVYLAREPAGARPGPARGVAIKRCHDHLVRNPDFATMFRDEARIVARIRHPNVVPTLEVADDEPLWIAMAYVEGDNLGALGRLAREAGRAIPSAIALRVMIDALRGLHASHELRDDDGAMLNVVHRDVTPQNILVGLDGVARVADFGIARAEGRRTVTHDGEVKGKLGYVAPEQIRGEAFGRRVDVYSAGVVLWETLTGERLFHGPSDAATIARVLGSPVQPPSEVVASVPRGLDALVLRALERDASRRFATASEFAIALECCAGRIATAREVAALVESLVGERVRAWRAALEATEAVAPAAAT